jgi:hypothetical protein
MAVLRLEQLKNVYPPIDVTLLGIVMLVKAVQPWNAYCPIDVMLGPMVTLARLLQLKKAPLPIEKEPIPESKLVIGASLKT